MAIKDVIVSIDPSSTGMQRLQVAFGLTRQFGSRLVGYYVASTAGLRAEDMAAAIEQQFEDELKRSGLEGTWLLGGDDVARDMTEQARTADLAILGLGNPDPAVDDPQGFRPDEVIIGCGRPVLGLPIANLPDRIGREVLLAWDGSRSASRALHDALPLLAAAASVDLVCVDPGDQLWDSALAAAAHLRRHGIAAAPKRLPSGGMSVAEVILSHGEHLGCDLVVAGAYGHSRMRESMLGGTSRTLLRQMMVPVLMSH